ncbi:Protein arginine N-methyltransferase 2 [Erysiphe neolycopersici]|uniref:Protein arginine N-methyltransferase 2 n=1 Tax=Erysiphe neolycopersici TaxID=212602 RepID=A0A420HS48_9PEZI|nr:Protein arginine N-methyltransferase 2 [Erysiphe neolycopersici]
MDDPVFAPSPTSGIDLTTQTILLHASNHDLQGLKPLLRVPGKASVQDPETGFTPLHAAIAACGPATPQVTLDNQNGSGEDVKEKVNGKEEEEVDIEKAKKVVEELFFSGAIWNDLDSNNETPGCLAYRLGRMELYEMCVNAGVRAELLLGLMGGYEELEGEGEDEMDEDEVEIEGFEVVGGEVNGQAEEALGGDVVGESNVTSTTPKPSEHSLAVGPAEAQILSQDPATKKDVNSADYLSSTLTFTDDKLLDADNNGVMMAWETSIMRRTVDLLLPSLTPGARILNIGFGMGIVDRMFRDTKPARHHIIEAHPSVLEKVAGEDSDFGKQWEQSAEAGAYKIHGGKWQDICPLLLQQGEVYDAIYFDTFGEDYSQLRLFFMEFVPGLLAPEGAFGFFNGLGADRRVCYDVYTKVVEMDCLEAGLDVEWTEVEVGKLGEEGEGAVRAQLAALGRSADERWMVRLGSVPKNAAIEAAFSQFYMQRATTEFADDLERLRTSDDFKDEAVPMLIAALKAGTAMFSMEEKKRIVLAGRENVV